MAFKNIKIPKEIIKEYEAPQEKIFALVWKEKIVKVHLGYKIENKYTTIWELLAIDIPQGLEEYKDEIMKVYSFDGDTSYLCDGDETCLDKVGKTIINF